MAIVLSFPPYLMFTIGVGYIDEMSIYCRKLSGIKGFSERGLFYETYKDSKFVSTLLTQISWSNHLAILSGTKTYLVEYDFA